MAGIVALLLLGSAPTKTKEPDLALDAEGIEYLERISIALRRAGAARADHKEAALS